MEAHVGKLSKKLRNFLKLHRSLEVDNEKNKIKCCLTGHEMPCTEEAVRSYVSGKKYRKAQHRESGNYEQYRPHIMTSTKRYHEHQLFCTLTLRHINMTPDHVARHVSGARYKRALARWQECEKKGIKFVPKRKRQNAAAESDERMGNEDGVEGFGSESGSDGEETGEQDTFDDLYPAADFEDNANDEDEASDFDFDAEDEGVEKKTDTVASVSKTSQGGESSKSSKRKGEKKKHKRNKKKQRTG